MQMIRQQNTEGDRGGPWPTLRRFGMMNAILLIALSGAAFAQYDPQGPAPLTGGGVDGMGGQSSPVTGAIEAVAPHPTDADTLLIGAVNGGIWRTTNATNTSPTWTIVSDSGSIADLKYDLSDGAHMTLLAGIGRTSSFSGIGSDRNGLLRSTNGGTSWSAITSLPGGPNVRAVEARGTNLVAGINVADSFFCTNVGVFHSSNTGTSFTQRLAGRTFDVVANPLTTGAGTTEMFASVDNFGGVCSAATGIHRSGDSGATWTKVSTATIDAQVAGASNVAISVGRQGGAGTDANVYVAICGGAGALTNLWRSGNSGTSWSAMSIPASTATVPQGIHPGGQCSLHLSLQADSTNHNVVYLGGDRQPDNNEETGIAFPGAPQFPNSYGASAYTGQLHRRDATSTLTNSLTHCTSATPASCPAQSTSGSAPHADSRDMGIDANGALIQSDDGGVYRRSTPLGVGSWNAVVGNLQVNEQHDAAYDTISNSMITGNQDNSNGYRDGSLARAATTWTTTDGGDGGDVAVGSGDPIASQSTRYSSAQNLGGFARRVFDSSNSQVGGTVFPALTPLGGAPAMTAQFVHPIEVNRITPSRIVFGGGNGVYESADRGDTISRITTDVIPQSQNFVYGTTGNANFLAYARSSDSAVCIRTAAAPTAPTCTVPAGVINTPVDIVVDPGNANRLVAVAPFRIFETINGGTSWSDVTGDLFTTNAAGQAFSGELIRNAADTMVAIVVGTRNGVFFDPDAAARAFGTYTPLSTGLGKAPVFDLQYDATDDRLLVGTLGRGAFTLDNVAAMVPVELMFFEIEGENDD